jgi:hypothetical protein
MEIILMSKSRREIMCHLKKKSNENLTKTEKSNKDKIDKLRGNWEKENSKQNKKEGSK